MISRLVEAARKLIEADPNSKNAQILAYLIVALEMSHEFLLGELYKFDYESQKTGTEGHRGLAHRPVLQQQSETV